MAISLECPACRSQTLLNDPTSGPVPCSGCGQLLRAPARSAEVGDLLGGGGAPAGGPAGSNWPPFAGHSASPGETFRPVESSNPYQSPTLFETPKQAGWTGASDPRVADRLTRWLGALIDNFFLGAVMVGGILVTAGFAPPDDDADVVIAAIVYGWLGLGVLAQSVLIALYGQSVGKLLLGTKIVNLNDDDNPGFLRAVVLRYWLQFPLSIIPFFSFLDAVFIFGEEKRCLHDFIAATRVIRIR